MKKLFTLNLLSIIIFVIWSDTVLSDSNDNDVILRKGGGSKPGAGGSDNGGIIPGSGTGTGVSNPGAGGSDTGGIIPGTGTSTGGTGAGGMIPGTGSGTGGSNPGVGTGTGGEIPGTGANPAKNTGFSCTLDIGGVDGICIPGGTTCYEQQGQNCCSTFCRFGTTKGNIGQRQCICTKSNTGQRCVQTSDCQKGPCPPPKSRKCVTSVSIPGVKTCQCDF